MSEIIGNTTATPMPRPDWNQTDSTKASFIQNKPLLGALAAKSNINKLDLSDSLQKAFPTFKSTKLANGDTFTIKPGMLFFFKPDTGTVIATISGSDYNSSGFSYDIYGLGLGFCTDAGESHDNNPERYRMNLIYSSGPILLVDIDGKNKLLDVNNNPKITSKTDELYIWYLESENDRGSFLEYLQSETLQTYECPMNAVRATNGAIAYLSNTLQEYTEWINTSTNKSYQLAFIDITDTTFDSIEIEISEDAVDNDDPWVCFAFLAEMPTYGDSEDVSYAEGYNTFKFTTYDCIVDIPSDAKYLVFYANSGTDVNYIPKSLKFIKGKTMLENLQDETLDEYVITQKRMIADKGVIKYYGAADSYNKYLAYDENKVMFFEITNTVFTKIILENADRDDTWKGWAFLKELPEWNTQVEYATGYTTFQSDDDDNVEIEIPEDAKYFVVYYQDSYTLLYYPKTITFTK